MLTVLEEWRAADRVLSGRAEMAMLPALSDLKAQLARLVHADARGGFIGEAGPPGCGATRRTSPPCGCAGPASTRVARPSTGTAS